MINLAFAFDFSRTLDFTCMIQLALALALAIDFSRPHNLACTIKLALALFQA
jgi:hypothetical protein